MPEATSRFVSDLSRVARFKIHPGIGIARVGNSPDEHFVGPEIPNAVHSGSYKDQQGRIKRQAARFRIFGYDESGNVLGEIAINTSQDRHHSEEALSQKVRVVWTVHLVNRKGSSHKFVTRGGTAGSKGLRNPNLQGDDRKRLVIDPGPRSIEGSGRAVTPSTLFDTGEFLGTKVPLGEIRTDAEGRLLVLAGFGKSASTKADNPIGEDGTSDDYWSDNDHWYDDVSDGRVSATLVLPRGERISIDDPKDAAWVISAPPKFAPGINPIVTLYDVIRALKVPRSPGNRIGELDENVFYYRDIHPILQRAADMAWVNGEARRGHGIDKRGDLRKWRPHSALDLRGLLKCEGSPKKEIREKIVGRLRIPASLASEQDQKAQATARFMPPLSGDVDDAAEGQPGTWLTLLEWQYLKFKQWAERECPDGRREEHSALDEMRPADRVEALQRAALEPCIGGPFHPGIETYYIAAEPELYCDAFRIDGRKYFPGDLTNNMALPWQADFYACNTNWWPSHRPDDVVEQSVFEEANNNWQPVPAQPDSGNPCQPELVPVEAALLSRVEWHRGLGVATLFRRPWNNPVPQPPEYPCHTPQLPDESEDDKARRSCDDCVRYWHELGFVLPTQTRSEEIVHVERERRPYAGMPIRDLFHALLNVDRHQDALPKVREYVKCVLDSARRLQQEPEAYAVSNNIRPFVYSEEIFVARLKEIYDDTVNFITDYDPFKEAYFDTKEAVIERLRQLTPFNLLDGAWLRNIHRLGEVDEVNATLFSILKEELGDGVVSENHANLYRDLVHSVGLYPPPIASSAFSKDPDFLDAAFESPTFQLAISEFTSDYYPELIGMTLFLEWTVVTLHRAAGLLERFEINSQFYRMHIGIDNAASGHGGRIFRAVQIYLQNMRDQGVDVEEQWRRIWDGYVAFGYTFSALISQIKNRVKYPPTLRQRVKRMIEQKREYGQFNHRDKTLDSRSINTWFLDPDGFLDALVKDEQIVPGDPENSPFFTLLEFHGGPMYRVFTEAEIKLWREWTLQLPNEKEDCPPTEDPAEARFSQLRGDGRLDLFLSSTSAHRVRRWMTLALADSGVAATAGDDDRVLGILQTRFRKWIAWGMVRVLADLARRESIAPALRGMTMGAETNSEQALTLEKWLAAMRQSSSPAIVARSFLASLATEIGARSESWDRLLQQVVPPNAEFGGASENPPDAGLGRALRAPVAGNDGFRVIDTVRAWTMAGCPLPDIPKDGRVPPLSLESTLDEEEHHPFARAIGFGRVS
jgi:hypothetical protein